MKIPIFNSLYSSKKIINSKKLDFETLNNLDFKARRSYKISINQSPQNVTKQHLLFETILVSINDKFVELFLSNKIKFTDISRKMNKMLNLYNFKKYKKIKPKILKKL